MENRKIDVYMIKPYLLIERVSISSYDYCCSTTNKSLGLRDKFLCDSIDGKPSYIGFHNKNILRCKIFYKNREYHNVNGPAKIDYTSGKKTYHLNGYEYSKESWEILKNEYI